MRHGGNELRVLRLTGWAQVAGAGNARGVGGDGADVWDLPVSGKGRRARGLQAELSGGEEQAGPSAGPRGREREKGWAGVEGEGLGRRGGKRAGRGKKERELGSGWFVGFLGWVPSISFSFLFLFSYFKHYSN